MSEANLAGEIANKTLIEALRYVAEQGIDLSKEKYSEARKIIRRKEDKVKYAFVPDREEAEELDRLSNDAKYRKIEELIPDYEYIDLIRTGLLMDKYQREGRKKDRVKEIKNEIENRPDGEYLKRIANFPTTDAFDIVIRHLETLKVEKDYSPEKIEEEFNNLLEDWEANVKFVEAHDDKTDVVNFIKRKGRDRETFFVLGMKSAVTKVRGAIRNLKEKNWFDRESYQVEGKTRFDGPERLEVTFRPEDKHGVFGES